MRRWADPVPLPSAAYPDWDAIYSDNVGRIYRLMFSKVGNRPDAEDLTSQVFLAAYGPLRATAGVPQVRAYLTAAARTVLAEHWRRTLGHQVTEIDLETTDLAEYTGSGMGASTGASASYGGMGAGGRAGVDAGVSGSAGAVGGGGGEGGFGEEGASAADERAARILDALPQRQRQILILRFLRGYTIRQAAAELGVTVANAKVLQHRALKAAARIENSNLGGGERGDAGVERVSGASGVSGAESASGMKGAASVSGVSGVKGVRSVSGVGGVRSVDGVRGVRRGVEKCRAEKDEDEEGAR